MGGAVTTDNPAEEAVVGLVGLTPEIESVLAEALADEGYAVRTWALEQAISDLPGDPPRLVVLMADRAGRAVALLDQLRQDERTSAVRLVVLGALEPMKEQAQASGNVVATIGLPFDLDDLLDAVHEALLRQPFEERLRERAPAGDAPYVRSAEILARAQRHIMLDWAQRIRLVGPFSERPDLGVRDFLDTVPRLVNAYVAILRHDVPVARTLQSDPDVVERIRNHAATRFAQGIGAEGVVREYQVLREVLANRILRELDAASALPVVADLTRLCDEAERITIALYQELAAI